MGINKKKNANIPSCHKRREENNENKEKNKILDNPIRSTMTARKINICSRTQEESLWKNLLAEGIQYACTYVCMNVCTNNYTETKAYGNCLAAHST